MPDLILNREQSRRVDVLAVEKYGMTGLVLMENAGRGAASFIATLRSGPQPKGGPVSICCGKGNNGGDGFVVARHLDIRRVPVQILLFCNPAKLTGDAAANYEIARRADIPIEVFNPEFGPLDTARVAELLAGSSLLVDALLGTGARGEPQAPLDLVIDLINAAPHLRAAIDIPSGLDCDTGEPAKHTIRADFTLTFVALKRGFRKEPAQPYLGSVRVLDIGVPRRLLEELAAERDD